MAITGHDVSNQSRNRRLLVLKEIFEEETDAEHGIAMKEIMSKLREYNIVAERRTIYEDIRVLQDVHKMDIEHHAGERIYRLKSRKFSLAEIKISCCSTTIPCSACRSPLKSSASRAASGAANG